MNNSTAPTSDDTSMVADENTMKPAEITLDLTDPSVGDSFSGVEVGDTLKVMDKSDSHVMLKKMPMSDESTDEEPPTEDGMSPDAESAGEGSMDNDPIAMLIAKKKKE